MANLTRKEKALHLIVKQMKEIDNNDILLQEVGMRFATQKIRLQLWDILTANGYALDQKYKLIQVGKI